jgi:carboxyl-terminal processing protease
MNPKIKYSLIGCISIILLAGMFATGLLAGWAFPVGSGTGIRGLLNPTSSNPTEITTDSSTPTDLTDLFKPFWQSWQIIHDSYVDQPVDNTLLMQGAIRGMLAALDDPHTSYMDPEMFALEEQSLAGEYEGIGAYIDTTGEYVEIISPITGSPAEAAGLKAGDLIVGIDGEDMTGVSGEEVHAKVLGPAGTKVTLTIRREGLDEPFDVTITRAKIVVPSVESKMLEGENLGYVRINIFGDDTTSELRSQLRELLKSNPDGLVLDLRGNGGGYLDTAIEVVSEFVDKGVVVYEEYGDGSRDSYEVQAGGLATKIPLVVLVDKGTASASEITAGAIQDYERGILVGTTTYGKGSVQTWQTLANDQGAIRVTIARWLTPKGRQINEIGIAPDYVVEFTDADIEAQKDVQLEKAIEVLKDLIAGKLN